MNILTTAAIYAGGPVILYGAIAGATIVPARAKKKTRYRPGQQWDYPPQWWAGDHPVATTPGALAQGTPAQGAITMTEGGARGTW